MKRGAREHHQFPVTRGQHAGCPEDQPRYRVRLHPLWSIATSVRPVTEPSGKEVCMTGAEKTPRRGFLARALAVSAAAAFPGGMTSTAFAQQAGPDDWIKEVKG